MCSLIIFLRVSCQGIFLAFFCFVLCSRVARVSAQKSGVSPGAVLFDCFQEHHNSIWEPQGRLLAAGRVTRVSPRWFPTIYGE